MGTLLTPHGFPVVKGQNQQPVNIGHDGKIGFTMLSIYRDANPASMSVPVEAFSVKAHLLCQFSEKTMIDPYKYPSKQYKGFYKAVRKMEIQERIRNGQSPQEAERLARSDSVGVLKMESENRTND